MTYKLNPELRKIQSPVVLVIDDMETEYPNGESLMELVFENPYLPERMSARDNKIVILLQDRSAMPDGNVTWDMCPEEISFF